MEVLWPQIIPIEDDKGIREAELREIFQKIEDKINKEQKEKFQKCKETLINNILKFYKILESNRMHHEEGRIEVSMIKNKIESLSNILERQNQALNILDDIKNSLVLGNKERKEYRDRLKRIFRYDNNACSIVFREYKETFDKEMPQKYSILMTGDITADIIDKYLYKKYLKDTTYQYIKCPHHGTDTHYTINIPKSDNLIISNGYGCESYHKISSHYFYHGNESIRKYCTNCRCEIHDSNRSCKETNLSSSCETKKFYTITIN